MLISLAIVAAALMKVCLTNDLDQGFIDTNTQHKDLLKGDTVTYSFGESIRGYNATFEILEDDNKIAKLENAITSDLQSSPFDFGDSRCTVIIAAHVDHEYLVVCGGNKIWLVKVDAVTHKISMTTQLAMRERNVNCTDGYLNNELNVAFFVCMKYANEEVSVFVTGFELKTRVEIEYSSVIVAKCMNLPANLKLVSTQATKEVGFVAYGENRESCILVFKYSEDKLSPCAQYFAETGSLVLEKQEKLLKVFYTNELAETSSATIVAITVGSTSDLFSSSVFSLDNKEMIAPVITERLSFQNTGGTIITTSYTAGRLYLVSKTKLSYCLYVESEGKCKDSTYEYEDISTGGLEKVHYILPYRYSIVLVGEDSSNKSFVIRFRKYSVQYIKKNFSAQISLVTRDPLDQNFFNVVMVNSTEISFSVIKEDSMKIDTSQVKHLDRPAQVIIACFLNGKHQNTKIFSFRIASSPQAQAKLSISYPSKSDRNLISWEGATKWLSSHNGFTVVGNAPTFQNSKSDVYVQYSDNLNSPEWSGVSLHAVEKVIYAGDNIYLFLMEEKVYFAKCDSMPTKLDFGCKQTKMKPFILKNNTILSAFAYNSSVILAVKNANSLELHSISDHIRMQTAIDIDPSMAVMTLLAYRLQIIVIAKSKKLFTANTVYQIIATVGAKSVDVDSLNALSVLSSNICPKQLTVSTDESLLYLKSNCIDGPEAYRSQVLTIQFELNEPLKITNQITLPESNNSTICAGANSFTVIDFERSDIQTIDFNSTGDNRYSMPFESMGLTQIHSASCENQNSLVQVLASRQNGDLAMVTYRTTMNYSARVHSIEIIGKASDKVEYSVFTRMQSREGAFYTILFATDLHNSLAYRFNLRPKLRIKPEFPVSEQAKVIVFFNEKGKIENRVEGTFSIQHIYWENLFKVIKLPAAPEVPLDKDVNLDDHFHTEMPWRSIKVESLRDAGFALRDRMEPISLKYKQDFNLTHLQLFDEFVVGLTVDNGVSKVVLTYGNRAFQAAQCNPLLGSSYNNDVPSFKLSTEGGKITTYDKTILIFAMACRKPSQIYLFSIEKSGDIQTTLEYIDLPDNLEYSQYLRPGPNNQSVTIIFTEPLGSSKIVSLSKDTIIESEVMNDIGFIKDAITMKDKLILFVEDGRHILIKIFRLSTSLVDTPIMLKETSVDMFKVAGFNMTANLLRCTEVDFNENKIRCLFSSSDVRWIYSLLIEVDISISKLDSVLTSVQFEAVIEATWNLNPVKVTMRRNMVAIVAINGAPKSDRDGHIEGTKVIVAYKMNWLTGHRANLNGNAVRLVKPYKYFTCKDIGAACDDPNTYLDAFFFETRNNLRFAVNIRNGEIPIKVYSIEGAHMTIKNGMILNSKADLIMEGFDGATIRQNIGQLLGTTEQSIKLSNHKARKIVYLIIGICIGLAMIVIAYLVLRSRNSEQFGYAKYKAVLKNEDDNDEGTNTSTSKRNYLRVSV